MNSVEVTNNRDQETETGPRIVDELGAMVTPDARHGVKVPRLDFGASHG